MSKQNRIMKLLIRGYAVLLVLFSVYAALDVFVIPRRLSPAGTEAATAGAEAVTAGAEAATASMEAATTTVQVRESGAVSPGTALSVESVSATLSPRITKSAHGESMTQTEPVSGDQAEETVQDENRTGEQVYTDGTSQLKTPDTEQEQTAESRMALDIPGEVTGTYEDENTTVRITRTEAYDTDIYIADIILSEPDALKTALAYNTYGRNVKQETSETARENDAILAINGDFYGSRTEGYVIRNGVLYRDRAGKDREGLAILSDGSFLMFDESGITADALLAKGATQVFSFGPALLEDGTITVTRDQEVGKAMASNPRTAIGIVDDLHYVFVVSDGRTTESKGLSLYELAQVLQSAGVRDAYNLDGGGSSTMVFQGEVINNPTTSGRNSTERDVSDIVYIGR